MKKRTLAIAAATMLSLGLFSATGFTDPRGDCDYGYHHGPGMHRQGGAMLSSTLRRDPENWTAMRQQQHREQLELLQGRLNLKSDQQQAWQAFSAAWDTHHGFMGEGRQRMGSGTQNQINIVEHFNNRIQFMEARLAELKNLAQAGENLYSQLTPEQRQIMDNFFATRPRFGWR